jgi:hypothetical protein
MVLRLMLEAICLNVLYAVHFHLFVPRACIASNIIFDDAHSVLHPECLDVNQGPRRPSPWKTTPN